MLKIDLRYYFNPKSYIEEHGNYNLTTEARIIDEITQKDYSVIKYYKDEKILDILIRYTAWYMITNFNKRVFFLTTSKERRKYFFDNVRKIISESEIDIERDTVKSFETTAFNYLYADKYSMINSVNMNKDFIILDEFGHCDEYLNPFPYLTATKKDKVIIISSPGHNTIFNNLIHEIEYKEYKRFSLLDLTFIKDPIKPPYSVDINKKV